MNISVLISITTLFITVILAFVVLLQNYKSRVSQMFFLLASSISIWIASNLLADSATTNELALFYSRIAIIWTAALPLIFNELIYNLYFLKNKDFYKYYKFIRPLSFFVLVIMIVFNQTSFNVISVSIQSWGTDYVPGVLYYVHFLYLLIFFGFSLFYLFKAYRRFEYPIKSQVLLMLVGAFVTIVLSIFTNNIAPLLGLSIISLYGPPTILFFVGFTALAIIRHHLFSVKVIATELITFVLWIFVLIRTLLADTLQDQMINCGMLLVLIIFGILLIRSVIKEVTLREKIELLAADLEKANVRLTDLDRQKSEFVSFATHQLRAPLTAMKGYASMMLEGDMGKIPDEALKGVSRIYDSSKTLTSIVDDYLNLTRIELGTMKYAFETIDLKALVEDTVGELEPNIEKSGLKFSFNADKNGNDYRITADRDKLKQVIANLIDNSMKYTPSGSIDVSLKYDSLKHVYIFQVKDTGIGIAPEVLPKLFQKWSRASNANKTNIKGTGLGLFVAKQILDAHHAKISVESPGEGKGSTFKVEFEPFKKA